MYNFIIGIGSQRAGSTLLHHILDKCTPIFMHPVKELHYYDTLFNIRHENILKQYSKRQLDLELDRLVTVETHEYIDKKYKCYIHTNKLLSTKSVSQLNYIDLYRPCIMGHDFLGEITPEYMVLPEEGVKRLSQDTGKSTKIILLARNPVKRFISAVKLLNTYNRDNVFSKIRHSLGLEKEVLKALETMPAWIKHQTELNNYESSLAVYRKYFSAVLFISYDDLITHPEKIHGKLEDFLSIPLDKKQYKLMLQNKINSTGITGGISKRTKAKLTKLFKFSQDYLDRMFGIDQVLL